MPMPGVLAGCWPSISPRDRPRCRCADLRHGRRPPGLAGGALSRCAGRSRSAMRKAVRAGHAGHALPPRILPGICQRPAGAEDVMRGEETQLLGLGTLLPGFDGVVCMPGTHSNGCGSARRRVERFATAMTGELFEVLRTHSVLRHSLAGRSNGPAARGGLQAGLDAGVEAPRALPATLFKVRAGVAAVGAYAGLVRRLSLGDADRRGDRRASAIGSARRGGYCRRCRTCRAVSQGRFRDRRQVPHHRWHRGDARRA